jgi:hypothetical protein
MSQAIRQPTVQRRTSAHPHGLKVVLYDQVASLLIALLVLIGIAAALLLAVWLSNRIFITQESLPVIQDVLGGGSEHGVAGESMEIESPDPEQIAQETDLQEPQLQDTVATVLDAVAAIQADLSDPTLTEDLESGAKGSSKGTGNALGLGEGGGPGSGFPRAQRWIIQFQEGGSLESYAKQLDFFKIELGAIGNTNQIQYAYNLAKPKPDKRTGRGDQEKRLYFSWQQGNLKDADRALLEKAGIATAGKILVQFFDPGEENKMAHLEKNYANRDASEIRKTRFGVRSQGGQYVFYVIDQTYIR